MMSVLTEAIAYALPFVLIFVLFVWSDSDLRARRARRRAIERKRRHLERAWRDR